MNLSSSAALTTIDKTIHCPKDARDGDINDHFDIWCRLRAKRNNPLNTIVQQVSFETHNYNEEDTSNWL